MRIRNYFYRLLLLMTVIFQTVNANILNLLFLYCSGLIRNKGLLIVITGLVKIVETKQEFSEE